MCGICGFTRTGADPGDEGILKGMCDAMAHRGPDGEGRFVDAGIALGHRRLSLIDLEGGDQPMVREGGAWAIVFNGEIYNYRELRTELEADGWAFQTKSDTEVLLTGYLAWGEGVLDRVRGMFAFAIWNRAARELFCARDPFGIKPFYYAPIGGSRNPQFVFASEIKSILEHPAYERELNEEALEQYLMFQFSALPETFFKGIFKLPPAHCLTVRADGTTAMRRYWRPTFRFDEQRPLQATVDEIDAAIRESVRYHNVADVEVGSFLSSGIDSSYLAACLAKEHPAIRTFTVGFAEYQGERDEVSWARELAERLGISNESMHVSEDEYWDALPTVQWHMDEPSADPSAVALYFVDKIAARDVKAVLSGEGADELFGGYRIYQAPLSNAKVGWLPKGLLHGAARALRSAGVRGASYLERASSPVESWYYTNANAVAFSPSEAARLLRHVPTGRTPQEIVAQAYAEARDLNLDETARMQYVDLAFWLVGDILLKTDKMSMAHSLESRVPFLDRGVFDVAATVPLPQKVDAHQTKIALRQAAERAIPRDWAQKEKLGFPVPLARWLRDARRYDAVRSLFASETARRFFDAAELAKLLEEHRAGADRSRKIWIVAMFLLWYRIYFVDRTRPARAHD